MFYGLHHDFGRRKVGVSLECLGHFCRADVGHFWKAPKRSNAATPLVARPSCSRITGRARERWPL
jgi:hypothetical protein